MPLAIDTVGFNTLNPGAVFTSATPAGGDSLTVRNFVPTGATGVLSDLVVQQATAGSIRIRSPRLHDNLSNLRFNVRAAQPEPVFPDVLQQPLYPQDLLIVEQTGGAAETEVGAMWIYYSDLGGVAARLYRWEEIQPRIVNYTVAFSNPTSSATIGAWGPGRALNADVDNLKANVDYAVIGCDVDTACVAVSLRGADTGNLRVGVPGFTNRIETRDWFQRQAWREQKPWIPVLNMANKGAILVDILANSASLSVNINWILAELHP